MRSKRIILLIALLLCWVSPPGQAFSEPVIRRLITKDSPSSNVLAYIPQSLHAGIAARTDTTDLTAYINSASDAVAASSSGKGKLIFPDGLYHYRGPLLLENKRNITWEGMRKNTGAAPIG
jgi:hypothetical protein